MAYLDLAEHVGTAHRPTSVAPVRAESGTATEFTSLQRQVIRLARNDSVSSLREETKLGEFLRAIFGWDRTRPLADPALEALRRIAVMSWHYGYNVHPDEIEAFLAAGYSIDHYEALLDHIGQARTISSRSTHA